MTVSNGYGTGYIPDLPDRRDWLYAAPSGPPPTLPPRVDLRPQTYPTPPYNQGSANSCVGNSVAAMHGFVDRRQGGLNINPARRQIYYDARVYDGLQTVDAGAYIRSALRAIAEKGAAPEELFPYDVARINEQPTQAVYDAAVKKKALSYLRVDISVDSMRACLAEGFPFVLGTTLYESYYKTGSDGMVAMPSGSIVGGHAQMYVGYDDLLRRFIVQGSWGFFGDKGFVYIPYDYAGSTDYSADGWTLRSEMEEPAPLPPPPILPIIDPDTHYKANKGRLVVFTENAPSNATFTLDGQPLPMSAAMPFDGTFLSGKRLGLAAGSHVLICASGGVVSAPFTFVV